MTAPVKFFIAGTQRTGTTLIRTSLSSHPDILCRGEVFLLGKKPYRDEGGYWHYSRQSITKRARAMLSPSTSAADYLNELYSQSRYAAIGFKLMLNHLQVRPYIATHLLRHSVKVLLVRRRNVLKTLVSRRSAEQSGVYHVSRSLKKGSSVEKWVAPKVTIDIETLVDDLESIDAEYLTWRSKITGKLEYIDIGYEDYVANQRIANESILSFLGAKSVALESDLKKVNPDELHAIVENYPEVVKTLRPTRFAEFLAN